jgi:DNA-binding transcriptional ArsR family regulator
MEKENFQIRDSRDANWLWVNKNIISSDRLDASDKLVYSALSYFANCNTQKCFPSTAKIEKLIKLTQPTIIKALKKLEDLKIIQVDREPGKVSIYSLLKTDHLKDLSGVETEETTKESLAHHLKDLSTPLKKKHTNNNNITIINNNTLLHNVDSQKESGKEINDFINLFKDVNPSYELFFSRKVQREAVSRLLKKLGREKLTGAINILKSTNSQKYAPAITSPLQLEEKLGSLIAFIQKQRSEVESKKINVLQL